jgi:hypothetical protein
MREYSLLISWSVRVRIVHNMGNHFMCVSMGKVFKRTIKPENLKFTQKLHVEMQNQVSYNVTAPRGKIEPQEGKQIFMCLHGENRPT